MPPKLGQTKSGSTVNMEGMGTQERSAVERLMGLGMNQADAIELALQRSSDTPSLIGLQGADKDLLDQAYSGAEKDLRRQAGLIGQDLAGTRGLNPSDTPVSEAVLREILPALSNLNSNKAAQSLGLGLNLQQLRQQGIQNLLFGAQSSPASLTGLAERFQAERFKKATVTSKNTPSIFGSINQGLDLASKLGAMGGAAFGAPPGMGGAAAGLAEGGGSTPQGGYSFVPGQNGRL